MSRRTRQKSFFGSDGLSDSLPDSAAPPSKAELAARTESACLTSAAGQAGTPSPSSELMAGKTVWVIDAPSLIHQVFHALPEMSGPRGEPVGAVFGFVRDLFFLLENKRPDYLFCAFDLPGPTFRHELYPAYKAHRPEMDADLAPQFASIRRVIDALGIPALECEGFEADDILATVARLSEEQGADCYLVTGDKDCRQLITDRVKIYNIRKDKVIDRHALKAEWGIAPEQVVDFQTLVGDPTDGVPGVPLIGPKSAQELLAKYGTLENLFEHAGEVPGTKRRQNLIAGKERAMMSRKLVRLRSDVPCPVNWAAGRVGRIDAPRLRSLFMEFGFRSLAAKAEAIAAIASRHALATEQNKGGENAGRVEESSALGGRPGETPRERSSAVLDPSSCSPGPSSPPQGRPEAHIVDTPQALASLLEQLAAQRRIAVDLETTAIWPRWAEIVGFSLGWREDEAWYLPIRAPAGERHLDPKQTIDALRPILENPAIEKVGQNLKYDMIVLRGAGIEMAGVAFDTMVASYLLDAGQRNHSLDDLAQRYLGQSKTPIQALIGSGKNQRRMDQVPVRQVADYCCDDAMFPLRLCPILASELRRFHLESLFQDVEMPLVEVLAEIEFNGIRVDCDRLAALSRQFGERIEKLETEIHALAGHPFNIASPKQLQQVLFEEQKLPVVSRTKTGPSTDADVLGELARLHPLPGLILEYRQYAKLKSTYVDALPQMVHPVTGRVHASFHQDVTATGRLSSSDPNLQNIPVRTEEGRAIRSAFVAGEPGWLLLAADYSQIELRVLAHFSKDQRLVEAFERDDDIHALVAAQIHGVALGEVTAAMRRQAKTVNFGVIYGQSPFGLSRQLGIPQEEAAKFIDAYFEGYPGVEEFFRGVLGECARTGYVTTILGRRRAIRGVRPHAGRQRNLPERTAINTVIQGSAADLIKQAMIATHRELRRQRLPARMLLQIHDELIFEVSPQTAMELAALVREEMANVCRLLVPLKVDVKVGPNWADLEPSTP